MKSNKNNIRVERAKLEISQRDLAKEMKVSMQSIHLIETGQQEPKLGLAFKISRFFGLKLEDIFNIER